MKNEAKNEKVKPNIKTKNKRYIAFSCILE